MSVFVHVGLVMSDDLDELGLAWYHYLSVRDVRSW